MIRRPSGKRDWDLYEICLEPPGGFASVPANNGVQQGKFSAYDDPDRFPNIAYLQVRIRPDALPKSTSLSEALEAAVGTFRQQQNLVDAGSLLVEWLGVRLGRRR